MATVVADAMNGTNWQDLHRRTGETGATWAKHPATPSTRWYIFGNQAHCGVAGEMYASGIPSSADYTVSCTYTVKTNIGHVGIMGRASTTARTHYFVYYDPANVLVLGKRINGVLTILANDDVGTMTVGQTYTLALDMSGTTIRALVNGVEIYSETDADISDAGRAGVRSASANDAHTGKHIDNFMVVDGGSPASAARRSFARVVGI